MPERNCAGCKNQAQWGCEAVSYEVVLPGGAREVRWHKASNGLAQLNGEDLFACPRQDIKNRPMVWHRMLLFYGMYKQGHLPDQGAVVDQSNFTMELFRLFDQVNFDCDEALDGERRRKQAQESRLTGVGG